MGTEIERKFRVRSDSWRKEVTESSYLCQAYAPLQGEQQHKTFRVRIAGDRAFLTLKAPLEGIRRLEFEYPIPPEDARILIRDFCEGAVIEKVRHIIPCPDGKNGKLMNFPERTGG